jgi:hypothetical protein
MDGEEEYFLQNNLMVIEEETPRKKELPLRIPLPQLPTSETKLHSTLKNLRNQRKPGHRRSSVNIL